MTKEEVLTLSGYDVNFNPGATSHRRTGRTVLEAARMVAELHNNPEYLRVYCVAENRMISDRLRNIIETMLHATKLDRQVALTIATTSRELIGVNPESNLIAVDHTLYE